MAPSRSCKPGCIWSLFIGTKAVYFVDVAHRRQGIARHLFAATFGAARRLGHEKIFTYVRANHPDALATYLSQGFRVIGTAQRHAKLAGQYLDEVMIERLLEGEN